MGTESDREKAVELAISQIERQFGKGSIIRIVVSKVDALFSGS